MKQIDSQLSKGEILVQYHQERMKRGHVRFYCSLPRAVSRGAVLIVEPACGGGMSCTIERERRFEPEEK